MNRLMIQGGWVVSSAVAFMHLKGKEDSDLSHWVELVNGQVSSWRVQIRSLPGGLGPQMST